MPERRVSLRGPVEADLVVDDPYIAASHLRLDADDENGFSLADLGSTNRFSLPARGNLRLEGAAHIMAGEIIRFGHTQIRIWHSASAVPPEVLDGRPSETWAWLSFFAWLFIAPGLRSLLTWVEATGPGRYGAVSMAFLSGARRC